ITFLSALALTSSVIISPTVAIRGCAAGCGKSHQIGYSNNGGVGFPFGNRTYAVLVPMNYDSTRRYALIVDFHGHSGTSDRQHLTSQYDKFDANGDFLVVYPQGLKYPKENGVSAWEGPAYADPTVDDKAFIADLVRYLPQKYCIDEDRIYASGKSNGGGFVGTLACSSQGSAFAAFALHSSALYTDNLGAGSTNRVCTPSRAVLPIIQVHGSADRTVKYTGGQGSGGLTPPIPAWLDTWAERN
ncbi:alpha/beta-hydrolase, partial [Thozetella sp. PMI_491]